MTDSQSTFQPSGRGVRRLVVAIDLERYSQLTDAGQRRAQHAMSEILREAGQRGALERAQWDIQPQGDGELALLPPGIDEAGVITSLMHQVASGLHQYNRDASPSARLRMRIAIHEGLTYVAESGFAGDAVNTACRLRDAKEAKKALRNTRNDVVLIVSGRIFRDVICGDDGYDLPPASFRETEIVMADKGFRAQAFIYVGRVADAVPDDPAVTGPADEAEPAGAATAAAGAARDQGSPSFIFEGTNNVGDIAGRDLYKYASGRPADGTRDE